MTCCTLAEPLLLFQIEAASPGFDKRTGILYPETAKNSGESLQIV